MLKEPLILRSLELQVGAEPFFVWRQKSKIEAWATFFQARRSEIGVLKSLYVSECSGSAKYDDIFIVFSAPPEIIVYHPKFDWY